MKKILIANRGEIAIRIARTCNDLGIKTVGIYSEDDSSSLHLSKMDESFIVDEKGANAYLNIKKIISIAKKLLGGTVRFHLGKLNFKLPNKKKGSEIGWHQDWAFYPHTNDDLITVGIYLDDCDEKNGPLKIIKNSHKKKLYSHHSKENYFVGKIDTKKNKIGTKDSVSITGTAGTVVFFHCRSVHGSGHNQMNNSRPLILFGYRACDAWPLINDGNPHPEVDLENYDKNIIVGNKSIKPRLTKVPTIIPLPKKKHYVSIYELQKSKN